jgi:hypothetical protein
MSTVSASERFQAVISGQISADGRNPHENLEVLCVAPVADVAAGVATVLEGEVARAWERGGNRPTSPGTSIGAWARSSRR